jgi:autotransporter strand-loop-strand O-heptosyltransferase
VKKVLFIVPHLSTGGMPQYVLNLFTKIKNDVELYCIEYKVLSDKYIVQRKKIIDLLQNNFFSINEDTDKLLSIIENIQPDIIHFQEIPEYFIPHEVAKKIYYSERKYRIIETCHNSIFNSSSKMFYPNAFAIINKHQIKQFEELKIPMTIVESDIEYYDKVDRTTVLKSLGLDPNIKHILNIGLFTPNKNQSEIFEYAKSLSKYPVQFHFVGNYAENFETYWKPLFENKPDNVKIWGELENVHDFYSSMDLFLFTSIIEANPLVIKEAIGHNMKILMYDLASYLGEYHVYENIDYLSENKIENVKKILDVLDIQKNMRNDIMALYETTEQNQLKNSVRISFEGGAFIQINGPVQETYNIRFIDDDTKKVIYNTDIQTNSWAKTNRQWFTNWRIEVLSRSGEFFSYKFNPTGKKVLIKLGSSCLGDTFAWTPYAEEFRKKWGCEVHLQTYHNNMFEEAYPEIKFSNPGEKINGLYASYDIGWYYNKDGNGFDFDRIKNAGYSVPLQQCASDTLGLKFQELKCKVKSVKKFESEKPYICIATHSTAQAKYWNNPTGWQQVVDYVKSLGYDVYLISRENDGHMGNKDPEGVIRFQNKTLEEIAEILSGSSAFIGLSSGLTWLSWILNRPTIMIAGITEEYQEMTTGNITRIENKDVCHGCFAKHLFDRGDWNWCPEHKGTERHFECTKSITFDMVKPHLEKLLKM